MAKKTFTTQFNRSVDSIRDVNCVEFVAPSHVKDSLSYATDINTIYDQYCKTSRLPLNGQHPIYDENFVKYDSLIEAQKLVNEASSYFVGLPAKIKNQYGNSLEKFVLALNNQDKFLIDEGVLNVPKVEPTITPIQNGDEITPVTPTPVETQSVNTAVTA